MNSRPTTRARTLVVIALSAAIGLAAGSATGADLSTFIGRTTDTATATISRTSLDVLSAYETSTTRSIAAEDLAFEYMCERQADGTIQCVRVVTHLAALDDDAAERARDHLADLQRLFGLDDLVALRCEAPFPDEDSGDGTTAGDPTSEPPSPWTSLYGVDSDFGADGTLSDAMTEAIADACNAIFRDGSANSGGSGGTGGLGDVDPPGMDFCGFEIGDASDDEIAAMAIERMSQMLEGCDAALEGQIMDGSDGQDCSNEIESVVCNNDGTETVCTGCGECWTQYSDCAADDPTCTPESGQETCSVTNGDGTMTTCDSDGNCYVEYENAEPTGNCLPDSDCVIDNNDGTVSVCPSPTEGNPKPDCYVRYKEDGEQTDHAAEDGYVVADAERDGDGTIEITTVSIDDDSGIETRISGTETLLEDERSSIYCFDAYNHETCAPCRGPRCRGLRRLNEQDCLDETCQTCQTLAWEENPKIVAECSGNGDIEVCKRFVESTECCADVTAAHVDPRLVRTAPEADYVCLTGEAELAQQQCEEQCWIAGDDCRISCASEYEGFLGLKEFDPIRDACWEMYWDGCFVDLPEIEPEGGDGGGAPTPYDATIGMELDAASLPTGPITPTTTTTLDTVELARPSGSDVEADGTVELEPVEAPAPVGSALDPVARTTTLTIPR